MELTENEKTFVKQFSDFVNGKMCSAERVGRELAKDHRYLVNQKAKIIMYFLMQLAKDYEEGHYDERNKWACRFAYYFIKTNSENE